MTTLVGTEVFDFLGVDSTGRPAAVKGNCTTSDINTYTRGSFVKSTGTFTCNGATAVTVADANVTASSQILVTLKTVGGTVGTSAPNVRTITAGTGFTIAGIASDTSVYNYMIVG